MSTQAPYTLNPVLTALAIMYKNGEMIADSVLPRSPVGAMEFKYTVHTKAEPFALPETQVGRTGKVGEVEFTGSESTGSVKDHGLKDVVPVQDVDNAANGNYNPMNAATDGLTALLTLRREKSVADKVFAAATYPTDNKQTLSGTSQWSDQTNSDPIGDVLSAMEACWMTPNKMILGRAVWRQLRTHPDIIKATNGNSGDTGIAARAAVAELFEVGEILVGQAQANLANKGQTVSMGQLWGKHASLIYIDPAVSPRSGLTFGMSPTFGGREVYTKFDDEVGLRGAHVIKNGESRTELITASDCGYLFTNAVA